MKDRKRFDGDYVRGGRNTLYLTRQDLVEALAMVRDRYPGQLRGILLESAHELAEIRESRRLDRLAQSHHAGVGGTWRAKR